MPAQLKNLTGLTFGSLVVVSQVSQRASNGGVIWTCRCTCGQFVNVAGGDLKKWRPDQILSCGCRRHEAGQKNRTHGASDSPEYAVWANMLDRCRNSDHAAFQSYGGRGISVCERWWKFENFIQDMGLKPSPDHELDRKDNDGNYEPENCRWATVQEQARNRRSTRLITFMGRTQCLTAWADELGISKESLHWRIEQWGLERALSTRGRTD